MGNRCRLILILALLVPPGFSSDLMGTPVSPKVASLPAVFEKNMGQAPSSYRFLSRHASVETLFSNSGVDVLLPDSNNGHSWVSFRLLGGST